MNTDEYLRLITKLVNGKKIGEEQVVWEVTVIGPQATAVVLSLLPDDEDEEVQLASFVKRNYLTLARDVVYPSILSPKIPVERLTLEDVLTLFPILYDMSFPKGDAGDEFQPQ